jgi:hypothetical protein
MKKTKYPSPFLHPKTTLQVDHLTVSTWNTRPDLRTEFFAPPLTSSSFSRALLFCCHPCTPPYTLTIYLVSSTQIPAWSTQCLGFSLLPQLSPSLLIPWLSGCLIEIPSIYAWKWAFQGRENENISTYYMSCFTETYSERQMDWFLAANIHVHAIRPCELLW